MYICLCACMYGVVLGVCVYICTARMHVCMHVCTCADAWTLFSARFLALAPAFRTMTAAVTITFPKDRVAGVP